MIFQAKKPKEDLKEVTHKVYFDVEIGGKPAGNALYHYISFLFCKRKRLALLEKKKKGYFTLILYKYFANSMLELAVSNGYQKL